MLSILLLAQASLFTRPLYMDVRPELRSAQHILIAHAGVPGAPATVKMTKKVAQAKAAELHAQLLAGADFVETAYHHSMTRSGTRGAVLGTFATGMLPEAFDEFLFSAELSDISAPISTRSGVHILRRVETRAAVLQIFIEGLGEEASARCIELRELIDGGHDFGELASEHSDDADSGARAGQFAIFERGAKDRLLKKAAFEMKIGEVRGPLESPLGLHLLKRVPISQLDPSLAELKWIRARGILIAYDTAVGADPLNQRTILEAKELSESLFSRLRGGEDFLRLAAEFNDDPGGRERSGDLGWIHRENPDLPVFMERLYTIPVGQQQPPQRTSAGFVILVREK
ncbi:MAG: parvulin-like peptidyl-prolyl isomerase [Planctomycetota bacterium]|jgi:parvulin-like peptidyl-prolyl isomerase